MTRIGATVSGMERRLLNQLAKADSAATLHSLRMASGNKVHGPADGPAAFLQISSFEQRLRVVNDTIRQVNAAAHVAAQTQLTLDQIRTQIVLIRDKAAEDQNQQLSAEERAANQTAIDAAIAEINRLAGGKIDGRAVLASPAAARTLIDATGANPDQVVDFTVDTILPNSSETISGAVTTAAGRAELSYLGTGGSRVRQSATFTLTGNLGGVSISVTNNEPLSNVRNRINAESSATGVIASVSGNTLLLHSQDVGSDAQVSVIVTSGTFVVSGGDGDGVAQGVDVEAVVNGQTLIGQGNRLSFSGEVGAYSLEFAAGFVGDFDPIHVSRTLSKTVGETQLSFALTPVVGQYSTLSAPSARAAALGGPTGVLDQLASGGELAGLGVNAEYAVLIASEALADLSRIEARVDSFADVTIASSAALLESFKEVLEQSLESINSADADEESLLLARNQFLISNTRAALAILHQQRLSMVDMIKHIAGLQY